MCRAQGGLGSGWRVVGAGLKVEGGGIRVEGIEPSVYGFVFKILGCDFRKFTVEGRGGGRGLRRGLMGSGSRVRGVILGSWAEGGGFRVEGVEPWFFWFKFKILGVDLREREREKERE